MDYNEAGVKALKKVEEVVESFGLPFLKGRKLTGVLNAIGMQIEDYAYTDNVVKALDSVLLDLAKQYASEAQCAKLERVLAEFERKLGGKR